MITRYLSSEQLGKSMFCAVLVLLCLQNTVLFAQSGNSKSQVYSAFFKQTIFRYDSLYHKRIDKVFISLLDEKLQKLDFDSDYLKDYLGGTISRNKTFTEHVQPRGNDTLSWLSYPWGLDRLLRKDRQAGQLLLAVDSTMHLPPRLPDCVKASAQFVEAGSLHPIDVPDWKKFYRKHLHCYGIVSVSDLVFSNDGRRAAFYYQERRYSLDGWGGVIFMKQTAVGWEEDFSLQFWVS